MSSRNHPSSECPSRDDLRALLGGSLDGQSELDIESHVSTCQLCGDTLEELCQNEDAKRWQYLAGQTGQCSLSEDPSKIDVSIEDDRNKIANAPEFEGFEILSVAGKGGMGIVYKARQLSLNRLVAIKWLHSTDPDNLQRLDRFRNEADSIASIQHSNVISIHEISEHNGMPYIVLEYIAGPNLSDLIKSSAPFDNFSAAQLIRKLALAIEAAHQSNLIHRDLKPANILMQIPERVSIAEIELKDCEPKITDFGLAKSFEYDNKTQTSILIGTPSYMSPEQITCPDDWAKPTVDVYALGVMLYELLTGKPPFSAKSTFGLFKKIESHNPAAIRTLNRNVAKDLELICFKCLEKSPVARYASAKLLADDLDRYLRREPVTARKAGALTRLKKWVLRNKSPVALASVGMIALFFLGSLLLNIHQQRQLALDDYQASLQKAQVLFEEAQNSDWRNLKTWDKAKDEATRTLGIQQKFSQLIQENEVAELMDDIKFHRSSRVFTREVDTLLLNKFLKYYLPLNPDAFSRGVESALLSFESFESASFQQQKDKLLTLDPHTFEGVIAAIYRVLLHDEHMGKRQHFEKLVAELDSSNWRRESYQAIRLKRVEIVRELLDHPDPDLSAPSLADFLSAMELGGSISHEQIAEQLKVAQLRQPTSFWLNYQLHWFIRRYQHPRNSIAFHRAALAQRELPALRLQLGHMFREMREFDLARQEFSAVLDQDPENVVVYRLLAACFRTEKNYDKAIENYKIALQVEPQRDYIRGNLLSTYLEAGRKKAAIEFANELIIRESVDHETYHSKAIAYAKMGKLDLAVENYELAIDADPSCLKCPMELAEVYFKQQKFDEARNELEKFIEWRPNMVSSLKLMMKICIAQKDYDAAEKYAKRRLSLSPTAPGYMSDLADIYVKSGEFELAEEAYLKSQSFIDTEDEDNIDKDNVYALEQLAILYNNQNKLEFAEATARRAIRIRPHAEQANFLLVQILCRLGRVDDALESSYEYRRNAPGSVYSHASVLNTLILLKRYEEAIAIFEQGRKFDTDPPRVFSDRQLQRLQQLLNQEQHDDSDSS